MQAGRRRRWEGPRVSGWMRELPGQMRGRERPSHLFSKSRSLCSESTAAGSNACGDRPSEGLRFPRAPDLVTDSDPFHETLMPLKNNP